jgi:sugar phosphate isomerase/epimerase
MNRDRFGMDTITLAGSLDAKLVAVKAAGFTQIMLLARDLTNYAGGETAAIAAVKASGLRVTGLQVLRDFEGLTGHLHEYKIDVAKAMLKMAHAVGAKLLLICSSTSQHASDSHDHAVADLRKLATLALPLGIKIAYEALSWGKHVNVMSQSVAMVNAVNRANFGLGVDSYHILATDSDTDCLDSVAPEKIFFVQLADFMWQETRTREEKIETARHFRVFPGEGVHSDQVVALTTKLDDLGYDGDYSFEVFNDDYSQLPLEFVAKRAVKSVRWLAGQISRRSLPLHSQAQQVALKNNLERIRMPLVNF